MITEKQRPRMIIHTKVIEELPLPARFKGATNICLPEETARHPCSSAI